MSGGKSDLIFEPGERTSRRRMRHTESYRQHLDGRGGPGYDKVRELVNDWFAHVPEGPATSKGRLDLLRKLRSAEDETWRAGFWELYLHESLRRMGYDLHIEPDIADSARHPDFLARGNGHEFYVEAAAITRDQMAWKSRRFNQIYDYLLYHPHPSFWLSVQLRHEGGTDPHLRRLLGDVQRWLDGLDPDTAPSGTTIEWSDGDWLMDLRAIAKSPTARTAGGETLIGFWSPGAMRLDTKERIVQKLHSKATRYGELGLPYLIALTANSFFLEDEDVVAALLGSEARYNGTDSTRPLTKGDGFFVGVGGPQNTRVSGVLVGWDALPTNLAVTRPVLWLNPWTPKELRFAAPLLWDHVITDPATGTVTPEQSDFDALTFFGLPPDWPGYETRPTSAVKPQLVPK